MLNLPGDVVCSCNNPAVVGGCIGCVVGGANPSVVGSNVVLISKMSIGCVVCRNRGSVVGGAVVANISASVVCNNDNGVVSTGPKSAIVVVGAPKGIAVVTKDVVGAPNSKPAVVVWGPNSNANPAVVGRPGNDGAVVARPKSTIGVVSTANPGVGVANIGNAASVVAKNRI